MTNTRYGDEIFKQAPDLVIPHLLPTLNPYINAERGNRYAASKIKKDATTLVQNCALAIKDRWTTEPVYIGYCWYRKDLRLDTDNVEFAKKFILDGLVKAGVFPNDTQKYVRGSINFHAVSKFERVELYFLKEETVRALLQSHLEATHG